MFDAVVAENSAVLDFPFAADTCSSGIRRPPAFVDELKRRGVSVEVGEALVEAAAETSGTIVEVIHALQQPLVLTFNRGRVMVLPQAVGKSTGLRAALTTLRSPSTTRSVSATRRTTTTCSDGCEVAARSPGAAPALVAMADEVVQRLGPRGGRDYIRELARRGELTTAQMGRRAEALGRRMTGGRLPCRPRPAGY